MKILVVDDEALLVKGIRFNLQNEGYDVITGSNGLEAVELAKDPQVGLIILDVMMPEMDGLTACAKISTASALATLPDLAPPMPSHTAHSNAPSSCSVI